jgi:prevent-host-death family protein
MRRRSVAQVRQELPALIRAVEDGGEVEVTRRGRPVAFLIGVEARNRLEGTRSFPAALAEFRKAQGIAGLRIGGAWLKRTRSREEGRKAPWSRDGISSAPCRLTRATW